MYIIKNAIRNVVRSKGRNIMIGIIILVITTASCIALSINKSGNQLITSYKTNNPVIVNFKLDASQFRNFANSERPSIESLTIEEIEEYGNSSYVKDYYYTAEVSLSSDQIEPISYSDIFQADQLENKEENHKQPSMNMGDFRLTGYSNPAYIQNFINGTNQMKEGSIFDASSTEPVILISEELATANNMSVGDEVTFYRNEATYTFTIIGIYTDNSEIEGDNAMGINLMTSANQIYTNMTQLQLILEDQDQKVSIAPFYYLNSQTDLGAFEAEVREKGLNESYQIGTNEEEVLSSLNPISNLSKFSITFLIVILIVGSFILSIINLIQIRERKYEIGVLRAIGMSKWKVTFQLVLEVMIVSIVALFLGTGLGICFSQPVTSVMLAEEIESTTNKQTQITENFGGKEMNRPGMGNVNHVNNQGSQTYVTDLQVSIDIVTILQLFLISLFLVGISSTISLLVVNQYEPNKILQNRS